MSWIFFLKVFVQLSVIPLYQGNGKDQGNGSNHRIRKRIIGLTANAMKGDKEKCLESGMDAYLTKPIIKEELYKLIDSVMLLPA
jgi:CheY-like chemotaxis protein